MLDNYYLLRHTKQCTTQPIRNTKPAKCIKYFLRYLYRITLNIPTCFAPKGSPSGNQTNLMQHKTKLATFV
jgi:hypothetical protein